MLITIGVILLICGLVAFAIGLFDTISSGTGLSEKAVARGRLGPEPHPITFTAEPGKDYSIYLAFGGITSNENEQEATVGDTVCEVRHPDGQTSEIRGDRQGTSMSLGSNASIGWFTAQDREGQTTVICAFERGSTYSQRNRAERAEILVTPGAPTEALAGMGLLVGGIFAILLSGLLLWRGIRGRRVPVT